MPRPSLPSAPLLPRELHLYLRPPSLASPPRPSALLRRCPSPTPRPFSTSPSRPAWASALASVLPSTTAALAGAAVGRGGKINVLKVGETNVPIADPIKLIGLELGLLRANVKQLLGSGHPALDTIAKYYFQAEGKHIRPLIVLLMSQATNGLAPGYGDLRRVVEEREERRSREVEEDGLGLGMGGTGTTTGEGINEPISSERILNDSNPSDLFSRAKSFLSPSPSPSPFPSLILPTQRRLAEITEMIHVASLLHDDVIDLASTRRGAPSSPSLFGNKLTVLAGDFLLARASLALSRLGDNEVVELVASVLANLVEGEVMQMKGNTPEGTEKASLGKGKSSMGNKLTPEIFEHYMKKTYLKTASLIAKSSRATTILGGCGVRQGWKEGEVIKDVAYDYGRNVGIAFQLVDDMLDFTSTAAALGKPGGGADLKLGLATAPALYAWEEFPELGVLIQRNFSGPDDVERAKHLISKSSGAARTAELAEMHSKAARESLRGLPESEARVALDELARDTLSRTK